MKSENITPRRIVVQSHDIMKLCGCSLRSAQKRLKSIRALLSKSRHQFVTIEEFARHSGIPVDDLKEQIR